MEARNIEDVLDGYDPEDWEDPNAPVGPSQAYGDFSDDWLEASDDCRIPEGEEELHAYSGYNSTAWCAAYLGDLEMRMTGCIDSQI